ncbi:zinc finger protein 207 [Babesia gibsoni]|uniref:Zinc finger protein 207 n=1 Tax=Babesia gibsoni TaxID=33632 RepID=A0AAD8LH46_BABGI|nr:zinc finger protein 207 [Babesia gibsoni]
MRARRRARHKGIGKKRNLKRGTRDLKNRTKDIDQIYEAVMKDEMELDVEASDNESKQAYCKYCDRYFTDDATLQSHKRGKDHKKRVKDVAKYQPMD